MPNMLATDTYQPVPHDAAFDAAMLRQPGVQVAYDALEKEYTALHALLAARRNETLTTPVTI
jgi:hypothetical protein